MKEGGKSELISWIQSVAVAFVIAIVIRQFSFTPVVVSGQSMQPTFENENKIVISKIYKIKRFDMIVFHALNSDDGFIKRVIGLPGDVVVMKNDTLYINGKEYEEGYIQGNKDEIFEGQNVKPNQTSKWRYQKVICMSLGDNRRNSTDSRIIGFVNENRLWVQ